MKKNVAKFMEENMTNTDLFLELEEGDLETLEVENMGQRRLLVKKIKELNDERTKKQEFLDSGIKLESDSDEEPPLTLLKSVSAINSITY
mmetsp:Transcript_11665/g.1802  ORF Transcript_11665/g.1802 Transcript_11665/m.1802 type:complete len:90 (+) Transcript_11665:642-911(+)